MANVNVFGLTVNYMSEPCGMDSLPRFSYKISSDVRGDGQLSRRICVYSDAEHKNTVWDEGEIKTKDQLFIPYGGEKLLPVTKYYFTVTVKTESGCEAAGESCFVTGKLCERWSGKWITAQYVRRENDAFGAVYLRKSFDIEKPVKEAYLSICGLGYFESRINGEKTGDDILSPAFTEFSKTDMYMTYDVKKLISQGKNAISVILGNGWYNCFAEDPWNTRAATWRHWPKMICELKLTYDDGTSEKIVSDTTWKGGKGPIFFNGIRNGEHYDARLELGNWESADYDDSAWKNTKIVKNIFA